MKNYSSLIIVGLIIVLFCVCVFASYKYDKPNNTTTQTEITTQTTTTTTTTVPYYSGVPYEGMFESRVQYTSLGKADEVESCTDFYKLRASHQWRKYRWKENGKTVFMVTISYYDWKKDTSVPGYVSDVCDWRSSNTTTYRSTTKRYTTKKSDPYNVNDYSNEEDFYYDNYDDFMDYYEAEDYYNEHHD